MSISLKKGQKISLSKEAAGMSRMMVGLGWDPREAGGGGKGILGSLFGAKQADVDCDASVFMLDENSKMHKKGNLVYYGRLVSNCGSIKHMGDNLTGDGAGDDEQIMVDLQKIPGDVHKLVFVVNIYDCLNRKQHFGMIQNAFIRIVDLTSNKEILKYNLSDQYMGSTAVIVGEIYRHDNEWKFGAIGEGTNDASLSELARRY